MKSIYKQFFRLIIIFFAMFTSANAATCTVLGNLDGATMSNQQGATHNYDATNTSDVGMKFSLGFPGNVHITANGYKGDSATFPIRVKLGTGGCGSTDKGNVLVANGDTFATDIHLQDTETLYVVIEAVTATIDGTPQTTFATEYLFDYVPDNAIATLALDIDDGEPTQGILIDTPYTYTVNPSNSGNSDAQGVEFSANISAGDIAISGASGAGWSCSNTATTVTCTRPSLAHDGVAKPISITASAPTTGTKTLSATLSSITNDASGNPASIPAHENTSFYENTVILVGSKIDGLDGPPHNNAVLTNEQFTYTLSIANTGNYQATGVVITDVLPAELSFVSSAGCSASGQTLTCNLGTINASSTKSVSVSVQTPANLGGSASRAITNNMTVVSSSTGADLSNANASEDTTIRDRRTVLGISINNPPDQLIDASYSYVVSVSNSGTIDADGVKVVSTLTNGLTWAGPSPSGWTCNTSGANPQTLTCNKNSLLGVGDNENITLNVTAPSTQTTVSINSTITTTTANNDGTYSTDSASNSTEIIATTAVLHVIKAAGNNNLVVGQEFYYGIEVGNIGNAATTGTVTVTDTLPAQISYLDAYGDGWNCSYSAPTVTCTHPALAVGETADNIIIEANATTAGNGIRNTANAEDTAGVTGSDWEDINIYDQNVLVYSQKYARNAGGWTGISEVLVDGDYDYLLAVENDGNTAATNVVITDVLPAGLIYRDPPGATDPDGYGWNCSFDTPSHTLTCTLAQLNPGVWTYVRVPVTAPATAGTVTNCFNNIDDSGTNRNSCRDVEVIESTIDLYFNEYNKWRTGIDDDICTVDYSYWYRMELRNSGTSVANDVNMTMQLPPEVTYYHHNIWGYSGNSGDDTMCSMVGSVFTCNFPELLPTSRPGYQHDGILVRLYVKNIPRVASTLPSTVFINESSTLDDTHDYIADIRACNSNLILKIDNPARGTVFTDENYNYYMQVKNAGPKHARGLTLTHTLPDGYVYNGYSKTGNSTGEWNCNYDGGTRIFECVLKDDKVFDKDHSFKVTLDVDASPTPGDKILQFYLDVDANKTTDTNLGDNNASYSTEVVGRYGAINVTKITTLPSNITYLGESFLYKIDVENIGDAGSELREVNITDTLDPLLIFNNFDSIPGWDCSGSVGNSIKCNRATISEGDHFSIDINVSAPNNEANITNIANVLAITSDANETNTSDANVSIQVLTRYPDLSITKTGSQNIVTVSRPFSYRFDIENTGNTIAQDVTITDVLPLDMNYTSYSGTNWTCTNPASFTAQTLTCVYNVNLPAGGSTFVNISVLAPSVVPAPDMEMNITNTANVSTLTPEDNMLNNEANETTTIWPEFADLILSQVDTPDPVSVGSFYQYEVTLSNTGDADAEDVQVIDVFDPAVDYITYVSGTPGDWICSHDGGNTLTCDKNTPLASGDTTSFIIHTRAPLGATTVTNHISATTTTRERFKPNNSSENTEVTAAAIVGFFPFGLRTHSILPGDIKTIGNTVLCEKVGGVCNVNTAVDNAAVSLDYVVSDANISGALGSSPFNASSADFILPPPSDPLDPPTVVWAGLYWQGMTKNDGNISLDSNASRQKVYLKNGTNSYVEVEAHDYHATTAYKSGYTNYAAMAEVTNIIQTMGQGKYTVANLATAKGQIFGIGAYGAWSLVIMYQDPDSDAIRSLSVYDGWQVLSSNPTKGNPNLDIVLSGFRTPESGNVDAKLSIFTAEGDAQLNGDTFLAQSGTTALASLESVNGTNPGPNNVMNSSISGVSGRVPSLQNNNGIDIQNYAIGTTPGAAGALTNDDNVLLVKMGTSALDDYFPSMMSISVELRKPDICYDYSIRQNGIFLDVDFPNAGDKRIPDLNVTLANTNPLTFNIYFKNRTGDIAATNLSMYTDFDLDPEDLQIKYFEDSVRKTDVNGSAYYEYLDSHVQVSKSVPVLDVRMAMGNNPIDAINGGTLNVSETQYLQFKVKPQISHLAMPFKVNLGMILLFDDGFTMNLPKLRLGKDIEPCLASQSYNPTWGQFTVIDKLLNPDIADDVAEAANFKYNLRTQVSNRPYDIDLVSLKRNMANPSNTPAHWEPLEANTTIEIEIADLTEFAELNASCSDSFNVLPNSNEFINFGASEWRKPLSKKTSPYAKRNVTYRIWFLEDSNNTLVYNQCGAPGSSANCYQNLYLSQFSAHNTFCGSHGCGGGNEVACYECLRGTHGKALCSRDNFSIRPEAFNIDNLKDFKDSGEIVKVPKDTNQSQHIAARSFYRVDINATSYTSMNGVPGYYTSEESNASFKWYEDQNVTCNDEQNINLDFSFINVYNPASNTFYSKLESNQSTPNIGKYKLALRDTNWTGVDKYEYAHHHSATSTSNFFVHTADLDDCVKDNIYVPTINQLHPNGGYRVGCNISSDYTKLDDNITNPYDFNDSQIVSHPDSVIFNTNTESAWRSSQYLSDTANTFVYMNGIQDGNESAISMATHLETRLRAVDENNVTLSNFTNSCYSQALDMNFSIKTWYDGNDGNISLDYRIESLKADGSKIVLSPNDTNRSSDINSTISGSATQLQVHLPKAIFSDDLNGTARVQLHLNIDREINEPKNPYRVEFEDINLTCTRLGASPLIPLNDCNITKDGETKPTSTIFDLSDKNVTFVFGRAHAPRYRVNVPRSATVADANISIFYEAYCDVRGGCVLLDDVVSPNKKRSPNSVNWYLNEAHNKSVTSDGQDGNTSLITQFRGDKVHLANTGFIQTNLPGLTKARLIYDDAQRGYPYRATMKIDTNAWLNYNKFDNNVSTANRFEIEFRQKGLRSGDGQDMDANGAVNSNRRIMW